MWDTHWVLIEAPADADPEDLHHLAQDAIGPFAGKVYDGVLDYGEFPAKAIGWRKDRAAFLARLQAIREEQARRFQEHLAALAGILELPVDMAPERIGAEVFRRLCNWRTEVDTAADFDESLPYPAFGRLGWLLNLAHGIYGFDAGFFYAWTGDARVPSLAALTSRASDHAPGQDFWLAPLRLHT